MESKQFVFITIGLPGSGKTTWAKKFEESVSLQGIPIIRVNNDEIREEFFGKSFEWTPELEKKVTAVRMQRIEEGIKSGKWVIVDNTHLNPKTLSKLKRFLEAFPNVLAVEVDFREVPIDVCIERDRERKERGERFVGEEVILKMAIESGFLKENNPKKIDPLLPFCIICDLDGTLALFEGKRNPYDASRCDVTDEPNHSVLTTLRMFASGKSRGFGPVVLEKIFFFSGRMEKFREPTKNFLLNKCWIDVENDPLYELHMRKDDDFAADEIIKEEMYKNNIEGKYNVLFVFDDRPKVIRMWKKIGLPVFNVGSGREF